MLQQITLHNICQHQHLEVEFRPGVNALIGPNGSGKSNLLLAIAGALTGDFGDPQNKCVAWNTGTAEAWIAVTLQQPDGAWRLLRYLQGGPRVVRWQLTDAQGQTWTGEKAVQERLQALFGVPTDVLRAHAFVEQWSVFDFLVATPSARIRQLQEMLGLRQLEKIWELLGEAQHQLQGPTLEQAQVTYEQARQRCHEAEEQRHRLEVEQAQLGDAAALKAQEEQLRRLLQQWERKRWIEDQLAPASAACTRLLEQETLAQEFCRQLQRERCAAEQAVQELPTTAEELAQWKAQVAVRREAERQQEMRRREQTGLTAELQRLRASLADRPAPAYQAKMLDEMRLVKANRQQQQQHLQLLLQLHPGQACPACRTPMTPALLEELQHDWQQELSQLQEAVPVLEGRCRQLELQLQQAERDHLVREQIQARLQVLEQELQAALPPAGDFSLEELLELEKLQTRTQMRWQQAVVDERVAREKWQVLQKNLTAAQEQHQQLLREWNALEVSEEQADAARTGLPDLADRRLRQAHLEGQLRQCQETILAAAQDCLQKQEQVEQAEQRQYGQQHLQSLRTLFHRDALPTRLLQGRFRILEELTNALLALFQTPFRLNLDDTFALQACFADGKVMEARRLSGAEKVVTAFSLRHALGLLLGAGIGFLCLDEAVVGLDRRYLSRLEEVLARVRELAGRTGLQIILVTHEQELRPLFDHVVTLGGSYHA